MLNWYKVITVTHKEVPLKELGRYKLSENEGNGLRTQLAELCGISKSEEILYLATCNRITYFFYTPQRLDQDFLKRFFGVVNPHLTPESFAPIKALKGIDALEHLARVASSVDSLVVGEREILRQLREAYQQSFDWGLIGDNLRLAMQFLVGSAKEVYSKTRIGEKPVSIVSLAMQELRVKNVATTSRLLLIGAGQTNTLVAKFLAKYGYSEVTVFNRTLEKAEKLAASLDGKALPLAKLPNYREGFDCMIVCTGVHEPIITKSLYAQLLTEETDQKTVIDLGIPQNVEEGLSDSFTLQYIGIEDLKAQAQLNLSFREQEVHLASDLILNHLQEFGILYQQRQVEKAMKTVPQEIKKVRSHALNTVFRKEMEELDPEARALVAKMMDYMEKRCIGIPMKAAREAVVQ